MKGEATRYGRLWPVLIIIFAALVLIGFSDGRYRVAALDPDDCDVVVGPGEAITSIQSAITHPDNPVVSNEATTGSVTASSMP